MHIVVTGGAGFIGSHVVDSLVARGDGVTVLDDLSSGARANLHSAARFVEGDVADAACVSAAVERADAVIHLAAIASVQLCETEAERAARTNVTGTETVFKAATARGIPIVYASSAAVYGDNPNLPLAEGEAPTPLGNYGHHKLENERIAARHVGVVPSVGLRFFNVYGPRQDPRSPYSGVISIFAGRAQAGETLNFFGDGEQTRDFIYVGDITQMIMRALAHSGSGKAAIYNGCTGRATSLKTLAAAMGKAVGRPITTHHAGPRIGDIQHSLGDPRLAHAALGFSATTPLAEGLRTLVQHG